MTTIRQFINTVSIVQIRRNEIRLTLADESGEVDITESLVKSDEYQAVIKRFFDRAILYTDYKVESGKVWIFVAASDDGKSLYE